MRSSRLLTAHLVTALFSLIFVALFLASPTVAHAQNGSIVGTVSGYVGSQTVQVSAQAPGSMTVYSANATPNYKIPVPPGIYNVSVTNPTSGWYINPTRYSVTVNPGGQSGDYNFTMMPMGSSYTVAGYVDIIASTCSSDVVPGTPVTVNITGNGYSSSQGITVPAGESRAAFQFLNLPVFGYYTVSVSQGAVQAASTQALTTTTLQFDTFISTNRTTFNICGYVRQANGQPGSGTVYIFFGAGQGVRPATVQSDGSYTFQNVPPYLWGVFMVNDAQWTYSPAWTQFQYANTFFSDESNIDFEATALVSDVWGNFTGLPAGTFGSVYLYQFGGSSQPIASTSTQGTIPWTFHNVAPGAYYVRPGAPAQYGQITPLVLGAFTVAPGASSVFAGTFNYVVTGSGAIQGYAWTSPKMTWIQTADTSPVLTLTGQYNDTYTQYFGNGTMYLYPQGKPLSVSMNLHPGFYSWTLTGQGPLKVSQMQGSVNIQPKVTSSIGSFIFTLPGPNANFIPNSCGSAVCSSGTPDVAGASGIKLSGTHAPLGVTAKPLDTTTCPTDPTADVSSRAAKLAATPHSVSSLATIGGGSTTTTGTCTTGVDFSTVPTIDFNGGFGAPDPNNPGYNQQDSTVPASNTTVQFTGVLYAAVDGNYQFQTTTNGPVALSVNDTSLINSWTDIQQTQTGSVYLTGGHQYPFTMSYAYDSVTSAQVNLSWQQPTDSAINTIDTSFYDQASTLVPLNDLVLQQFGLIVDNYTTGDPNDQQNALAAGYTVARTEGCVYTDQQNGTIPLYVYNNGTDNLSTATPAGQSIVTTGNYANNGLAGYIYPTPLTDGSSIPLQNWFGNNDYYATASQDGISAAQQAGYVFIQTEGYVLPASSCQ